LTKLEPLARPFLPDLTPDTREFWTSGREGVLRINYCSQCSRFVHPPVPICPFCRGDEIVPTPVSGRGKVYSYTINYQQWTPEMNPPYALGIIEIDEQSDVRITSNIVGCSIEDIQIGLPVMVEFEQCGSVYIPVFRPVAE
jgi:uncharacterized OB-fold protein